MDKTGTLDRLGGGKINKTIGGTRLGNEKHFQTLKVPLKVVPDPGGGLFWCCPFLLIQ
jgi:hypothetical protein